MKNWIMDLCPEIAEWQAELITEQILALVLDGRLAEREACAKVCEENFSDGALNIADAIRARGQA